MRKQLSVNNYCTMLHRRCLTGLRLSQRSEYTSALNIPGFCICLWYYICQGFEYTRVLNMLGLHRNLSMSEYFLGMPFTLFNKLGTKVISKTVILPRQKALKSIAKSWKLLCNCKKKFVWGRFFSSLCSLFFTAHFFHANSRPAVNLPYWPWCSMLETLGNKNLSVEQTLSKTAMIET